MDDTEPLRADVVQAIVRAMRDTDPVGLPADATKAEKAAATDEYLSGVVAGRAQRDRQSRAWELLLRRSYDEPPTWTQVFDDLPDDAAAELGELYDALPVGAQEEFARRHGVPQD